MWVLGITLSLLVISFGQCVDVPFPIPPRAMYKVTMEVVAENLWSGRIEVEDIFDPSLNKSRMLHTKSGITTELIFDYNSLEYYKIMSFGAPQCTANKLPYTNHADLYSLNITYTDKVSSALSILSIPKQNNIVMKYEGNEYHRNVMTNKFVGFYQNSNLTYWFTDPGEDSGSQPVAMEMHVHPQIFQVEFFNYKTHYPSERTRKEIVETYLTPVGVYCEGRALNATLPRMPDILIYSQETFTQDPEMAWVFDSKVEYDALLKLVSYDGHSKTIVPQPPFYPEGSMQIIHDFNTGVAYHIDDIRGNCSMLPIHSGYFDTADVKSGGDISDIHYVQMRSPNDIFKIDGNYSYNGNRLVRGLSTDYFMARRSDYRLPGFSDRDTLFELYFLDKTMQEAARTKGFDLTSDIPIKMVISPFKETIQDMDPTQNYLETYNFFNFHKPDPDIGETPGWKYDVTQCFTTEEKKTFRIIFDGPSFEELAQSEVNMLSTLAQKSLVLTVGSSITPLRFQRIEVDYNETNVFVTVTLLAPPPLSAQFITVANKTIPTLLVDYTTMADSLENCQSLCNREISILCQSFSYNPSQKVCAMSKNQLTVGQLLSTTSSTYFARPVIIETQDMDNEAVISTISNAVNYKMIQITLPSEYDEESKIYTSVGIIENVLREDDTKVTWPLVGKHLRQFNMEEKLSIRGTQPIDYPILADECARLCLNDASETPCQSFTYNFKIGTCVLSSYSSKTDPDKISVSSETVLFERNALARYTKYSGQVLRNGGSTFASIETTPEDCATKCTDETDIQCRSFDLCTRSVEPLKYLCYLNEGHALDEAQVKNKSEKCDHYSRGYEKDFTQRYTVNRFGLDNLESYDSTNLGSCARRCVETAEEKCKGFFTCSGGTDYMGNPTTTCALVWTDQLETDGTNKGMYTCTYNERTYLQDGSPYTSNVHVAKRSPGLSAGGAVALALGMLFIGIVLTAVAFRFIPQLRPSAPSDANVQMYFHKDPPGSS